MKKTLAIILLALCVGSAHAQHIARYAGNRLVGSAGEGVAATAAALNAPVSIAYDFAGNLYISDINNSTIRRVNTSGIINVIAGGGTDTTNGVTPTSAYLFMPRGIAVNSGNIYVAVSGYRKVRKIVPGVSITDVAGGGAATTDSVPATSANISRPIAVTFDQNGVLYIASDDQHIYKVDTAGRIRKFAGNGSTGYVATDSIALSTPLNVPAGICSDQNNNIYIADQFNNVIRKVTPRGIISTIAGNPAASANVDGVAATATTLNSPTDVKVDNIGNIYICEQGNNKIRKVDTFGIISTVTGTGTAGYSGDGGPALWATINSPTGLAILNSNNIAVADTRNSLIRKITPSTTETHILENAATLAAYPNPTSDKITIEYPAFKAGDNIKIVSTTGITILEQAANPKTTLDLTSFPTGQYFIQVHSGNIVVATQSVEKR